MENNEHDFMKNRPVAASANQIKDVYGSQKTSTRVTVTVVLAVIDLIILIIGLVTGNWFLTAIFAPLLVVFVLSIIIGIRADRQNTPPVSKDTSDAIFKDHE
jgi:uncharacterized membrane-anchored protein YitT (DUF2179 family)